jgi:peptide/nickel transport system substrate-binding protein
MRKLFVVLSLLIVASMLLSACGGAPATPQTVVQTVVVAGTPQVVEVTPTTAPAADMKSKDPTTLNVVEPGLSIDTLDPALAYDTASAEILQNTYNTLVFYDGAATDKFVPMLAESWTTSPDGKTWVFTIRKGVKFHNGDVLTPTDVAYSFQRGLLQGGSSSPQWLLYEAFFGVGTADITDVVDPKGTLADDRDLLSKFDPAAVKAACDKTQAAIVADDAAGTVTMTLAQPWGPFLATIAQTWGSVMDKKWVAENKGWDGTCDTWQNFYGMASADDPFSTIENGTGPFKLDSLKQGEEIIYSRYDDYFGGPAKLARVVYKNVDEWGTRFAMMQAGDADIATVPVANRSQMDALVGEKCNYDMATTAYKPCEVTDPNLPLRVYLGSPLIQQDVILYNWNIASDKASPNPYLGSGKLDGAGIPSDFFSDVHVRKAFSYCFDWDTYINDIYKGEAVQSFQLTLPGMPGFFADTPHYTFDLDKCAEEFKASTLKSADGKSLWDTGFRIQMAYNQGNTTRQTTAEILAGSLSQVNDKFQLETLGLPWAAYLRAQRAKLLPIMVGGWLEDIHDPHNWYQPYTTGTYGGRQSLPDDVKAQFKAILDKGVAEIDPAKRADIYKEANQLYYDLAVGTPIALVTAHGFRQRWLQGEIINPIFPGFYFYTMSKN